MWGRKKFLASDVKGVLDLSPMNGFVAVFADGLCCVFLEFIWSRLTFALHCFSVQLWGNLIVQ